MLKRISNFIFLHDSGDMCHATVDISYPFPICILRRKRTVHISSRGFGWRYEDTGCWTEGLIVEDLYKGYLAKKARKSAQESMVGFPIPEDMRDKVIPRKVMYEYLNERGR